MGGVSFWSVLFCSLSLVRTTSSAHYVRTSVYTVRSLVVSEGLVCLYVVSRRRKMNLKTGRGPEFALSKHSYTHHMIPGYIYLPGSILRLMRDPPASQICAWCRVPVLYTAGSMLRSIKRLLRAKYAPGVTRWLPGTWYTYVV